VSVGKGRNGEREKRGIRAFRISDLEKNRAFGALRSLSSFRALGETGKRRMGGGERAKGEGESVDIPRGFYVFF